MQAEHLGCRNISVVARRPGQVRTQKVYKKPKKVWRADEFAGTPELVPSGWTLRSAAGGGTPPWGHWFTRAV
jgi:hypothetical protein